uniref:Uncharacterized protein n=1 Tax=Caenorhabditis japonica TaxID=281687 RepID=A0A8R1DYS0_CAEJA
MQISGTSSTSAEFSIDFFAPLAYTYPPDEADLYPGQSLTSALANTRVKTDLDLAISKALTDNQIYFPTPPTVNFTYTPPQIVISDGEKCTDDGTWIAISGTVLYKCGESNTETTQATSDAPDGSTEIPTTTIQEETTTSEKDGRIQFHKRALPRRRAATGVSAQPFVQSMTVVATSSQSLYASQWKQIGRSVQTALEAKKMLFNDEIAVNLL